MPPKTKTKAKVGSKTKKAGEVSKSEKLTLPMALKKCFSGKKVPEEMMPEFEKVLANRRVDLFPSNFGLNKAGKPMGGFYTFVNDPVYQQRFFSAMARFFFPVESPSIIGDLFPSSCYVTLTYLVDTKGEIVPETMPLVGPFKTSTARDIKYNPERIRTIKTCLKNGVIARVALKVIEVSPSGEFVSAHSLALVLHPMETKKKEKWMQVTVLDPAASKVLAKSLNIINTISKQLGGQPKLYVPGMTCRTSFQGESDLCATWTMFLILTSMVNPAPWWPEIEKYLLDLPEEEAHRLVYQFAWWFIRVFGSVVYEEDGGDGVTRTYREIIDSFRVDKKLKLPEVKW